MILPGLIASLAAAAAPGAITADGKLDEAAWRGAQRIALSSRAALRIRTFGDAVAVGVTLPPDTRRYLDLYIADASGRVRNFHQSLRQGERLLHGEWSDDDPRWTWEPTSGWSANIARRNPRWRNGSPEAMVEPVAAYEAVIPLRLLGPGPWRYRVEVRDFEGKGTDWVYPIHSIRHAIAAWAKLPRRR